MLDAKVTVSVIVAREEVGIDHPPCPSAADPTCSQSHVSITCVMGGPEDQAAGIRSVFSMSGDTERALQAES